MNTFIKIMSIFIVIFLLVSCGKLGNESISRIDDNVIPLETTAPTSNTSPPSDKESLFQLVESSNIIGEELKKKLIEISQIELNAYIKQGSISEIKINAMDTIDLDQDGKKEVLISINYRKGIPCFGRLQILKWNGASYKQIMLGTEHDDVIPQYNFTVIKLSNHELPQIISWWYGGNKAFLTAYAEVIDVNSFKEIWRSESISAGDIQITDKSINILKDNKIVSQYPTSQVTEVSEIKEKIDSQKYFPTNYSFNHTYMMLDNTTIEEGFIFEPLVKDNLILHRMSFNYSQKSADGKVKTLNTGVKFYTFDKTGSILEVAINSSLLGEVVYETPKIILKNGAVKGDTWEYRDRGDNVLRKFIGFENVKTKAGEFENCIKIEETITASDKSKYTSLYYYAPHNGLVLQSVDGKALIEITK